MQRQLKLLKTKVNNQFKFQYLLFYFRQITSKDYHRSQPKLELADILKMSPQKIDLMKKYRNKICNKLAIFKEIEQINKDK